MSFYSFGYSVNNAESSFRVYHSRVNCNHDGVPSWSPQELDPRWYPKRVQWSSNGDDSTMVLDRRLAGESSGKFDKPEMLDISAGDMFRLVHVEGGKNKEIFCGYAGQGSFVVQAQPDSEKASIVVYGPELLLKNIPVTGAWYMSSEVSDALAQKETPLQTRDQVVSTYLPVVFNESGNPNASAEGWSLSAVEEDSDCCVFVAGTADGWYPQGSQHWDAYHAVKSLVNWFDTQNIISPQTDWEGIKEITSVEIGEVNVTAKNLLEAIGEVLLPAGFGFSLDLIQSDGGHRLNVWQLHGQPACSGPYLGDRNRPQSSTSVEGSRCTVQRIDFVRDNHNVKNDIMVIGSPERVDEALGFGPGLYGHLQRFWDTELHDLSDYCVNGSYDPRNWTTQQTYEFCSNYSLDYAACDPHALRSFAWNEDGGLDPVLERVPDINKVAVDGKFIRRPRPIGAPLSRQEIDGELTRAVSASVEMGIYVEPDAWIKIPAVIWKDRAGFTITRNNLHDWYPYATHEARGIQSYYGKSLFDRYGKYSYIELLHKASDESLGLVHRFMMLKVSGSIETDRCLTGRAKYNRDSSWPMRSSKVVYLANRFKNTDLQDDSESIKHYALQVRGTLEDSIGHGSIVLRGVDHGYRPGQSLKRTRGRKINLCVAGREIDETNKISPVIVRKIWDMSGDFNKTELVLETPILQVR